MIKSALAYLVGLGEAKLQAINTGIYSDKPLTRINEPVASEVKATTLTALVDYLKSGIDKKSSDKLLVHVVSPSVVTLRSELNGDCQRDSYMRCEALPPNIHFGLWTSAEEFNIMLQSNFTGDFDKPALLLVTGTIQEKIIKDTGDDGISQSAVVKTGIAKAADVVVPNPVTLAPFRTFPEIEQPASRFIFRMQTGPVAALFEADGGAWRNEAMRRIHTWLEGQLADVEHIRIIS